jgi:hypothetical protein
MAKTKLKPTHLIALQKAKYGYSENTIFNAVERREYGYLVEWKIQHPYMGWQSVLPCECKVIKKIQTKKRSLALAQ